MRYPIILQHDATDCGPAVLAMIAAKYKKRISIARLRELAGTDEQGTNLAGLTAAAEQVGFSARAVRGTHEALLQIPLPAVAHWREGNRNHFIVLYHISAKRMIVGDPAAGLRKIGRDEFLQKWTGVLVLLTPSVRLRGAIQSQSSFTRLCSLLLPHSNLFLDALVAAVLLTILGLTSSFFIQALVDFVFVLGRKPALNWLGLGMLLVTLARAGFLGLRSHLLAHLSQRIDAVTMLGYHRHLLGLPLSFFSSRRTGEILSRMNDAIKIRIAISGTTLSLIVDSLLVLATAGIMAWLNQQLAIRSLLLLMPLTALLVFLCRRMKRHQRRAIEKGAEVEAQMVETIGAMYDIKAFRAESAVQLRTEARFAEMLEPALQSQLLAGHCATVFSLGTGLATLGLLWFGGHQVLAGVLTPGRLMAFYSLLTTMIAPVERLATANQSIQDAVIAADRLGEILDLPSELDNERSTPLDCPIQGSIEFHNLTFRYGSRAPLFRDLNLQIKPGECIGISGRSGCGKTTIVNLLARFLSPTDGRVFIDGVDIRDYRLDCLRREVAFVPQEVVLLNGTIADNIRLGKPTASAAEIRAASFAAHVHEFVEQLPFGYDTIVGERGLSISGGERQRIAIARALLLNPSILVLDEPTSHLDLKSELAVQSLIDQRRRAARTTIVISHRPLHVGRQINLDETQLCVSTS